MTETDQLAALSRETADLQNVTIHRLALFLGIVNMEQSEAFDMQLEAKLLKGDGTTAFIVCRDYMKRIHDGAIELIEKHGNVPLGYTPKEK
jgi:hypothetical protein